MLGAHIGRDFVEPRRGARPTITAHIRRARAIAADSGVALNVVQFFAMGPRDTKMHLTPEECEELAKYAGETGIRTILHNTYMAPPWKINPFYARTIREELRVARAVSHAAPSGVVVHLGIEDAGAVAARLPALYIKPEAGRVVPRLYLETPAVRAAHAHYNSPDGIIELFRRIREGADPALERTGLCIDTAHLWASGVDIRTRAVGDAWVDDLLGRPDILPPECIMIHLNDNKNPLGVIPDHHALLCQGLVWGHARATPHDSGLGSFVKMAIDHSLPLVLERSGGASLPEDYATLFPLLPPEWKK